MLVFGLPAGLPRLARVSCIGGMAAVLVACSSPSHPPALESFTGDGGMEDVTVTPLPVHEAGPDSPAEANESGADVGADVVHDAASDVTADVAMDVVADAGIDVTADAAIDVVADAGIDVTADVAIDVVADAGIDVTADVAIDVAADAAMDVVADVAGD
jgi:hypothetical protein